MKLITTNGSKVALEVKEMPNGILKCEIKHKISDTEATMIYGGPKIPADEWRRVLSFFRWTYKETHSESQVRGYLDPVDNTIRFWAFPQKRGGGMTTEEIDNDDSRKQRQELPNAGSLIYFVTAHHHCSSNAFQSGGDQANEVGQDGLHITIGNMDKSVHDMDARFYMDRIKFAPKMDRFWDIGTAIADATPSMMHDVIARYQMCQGSEVDFPQQWKDNLIDKKYPQTVYRGGMGYGVAGASYNGSHFETLQEKIERVAGTCMDTLMNIIEFDTLKQVINFLRDSTVMDEILDKCQPERFDALDIRGVIKLMDSIAEEEYQDMLHELAGGQEPTKEGKKARRRRKKREAQATQEKIATCQDVEKAKEADNAKDKPGEQTVAGQDWGNGE